MNTDFDYKVLVNAEGQYSIWPETKSTPPGWQPAGPTGTKEEVSQWIRENWTDMRPTRLRNA